MFFFQAEDGIRDLVRSRGLGDVYKRQGEDKMEKGAKADGITAWDVAEKYITICENESARSVSYTHLTLPTSDLV